MTSLTAAIVTYNRSAYLARIIPTILAQTFRDFELLVLDNASTDDTAAVVRSFADPRIRYLRHDENIGGCGNLNAAIDTATSEFLVILHDDDLLEPQLFEREIAELRADPTLTMVTCNGHLIDADDVVTGTNVLAMPTRDFLPFEYVDAYVMHGKNLFLPAHMYRVARLRELGLRFRPEIGNGTDAFFVNSLNLTERIRFLDEPLFRYRVHHGQWCRQLHDALRSGFLLWSAFRELGIESGRLEHWMPPVLSKLRDSYGFQFLTFCFSDQPGSARVAEFVAATHELSPPILAELELDPKFRLLMSFCDEAWDWRSAGASASFAWTDPNWNRNQRAFALWERLRSEGRTLSHRLATEGVRRVAIFGATLVGYFLQQDLRENGIDVVVFLENRRDNLGFHFSGRRVHSPEWMEEHGEEVDAVLTACFSDADLAIAERFKTQPRSAPGWVASWRELLLLEAPELMLGGVNADAPRVLPDFLKVA